MIYNLAIIGGGPAGYSAALEAIRYGLTVILFEKDLIGGTCLNRGCVPTKSLIHAATIYADFKKADRYGIHADQVKCDYSEVIKRNQQIIKQLRDGLETQMKDNGIRLMYGEARLIKRNQISCNGETFEAENVLISTGSSAGNLFHDISISTDEMLERNKLPASLKIIGGGVISIEFASIFNKLGIPVTICIRGEHILRTWDTDIRVGITQNLKKHGIRIKTKCQTEELAKKDADVILCAAGRERVTDGVSREYVDFGENGGILTDSMGRTKTKGIYAAGDVTESGTMLAHVAMVQGKCVVRDIAGDIRDNPLAVVKCIYMEPEVASIGLIKADNIGIGIRTIKQGMYSNARTLIETEERGFIKLIAAENNILIGAQLMCNRASDIASELAFAINQKLKVQELLKNVRPHPSYSEAITETVERYMAKYR